MQNNHTFRVAQKILLFNLKKEVLLLRFSCDETVIPKYMHGKWDFPGGGLEWSETRDEGLKREIKEEVGDIAYKIGDLIYVWDWYHHKMGGIPTMRTVCVLYDGKYLSGEIVLNKEHDRYQWVSLERLNEFEFYLDDQETVKKIIKIYDETN